MRLGALATAFVLQASSAAAEPPACTGLGVALRATKILTAAEQGPRVLDHGIVVIGPDCRIAAVGVESEVELPQGVELIDLGELWLAPGMVDLHSHIAGTRDINDAVYQVNSGLRVSPAVVPRAGALRRAVAAGVTTILFIPGSATNVGGQGVLLKTGFETYEEMLVRQPGSLKIAQGDNPKRWGYGMQRGLMNFHIRGILRRGAAYARAWDDHENGEGPRPERDIALDVFRELAAKRTQISTHTQYYQLVMMSILLLAGEFGFDTYIDHGSFDSYLTAPLAIEHDVPAILGPRMVMWPLAPRFDTDGSVRGSAQGFQAGGVTRIGFNTDAPVIPQEELPLQAAMGVRFGLTNENLEAVRGLTLIPAHVAGIADRVGSLEVGKDADILAVTGDPADPRTSVMRVWIEGREVYDAEREEVRAW